jgi:hypothetical protein
MVLIQPLFLCALLVMVQKTGLLYYHQTRALMHWDYLCRVFDAMADVTI